MAAGWFQRAAGRGDAIAQLNLGELYETGRGLPRDLSEAWIWYSLAARLGNEWAQGRRDAVAKRLDPAALAAARARLDGRN